MTAASPPRLAALMTSANEHWNTPAELLDCVRRIDRIGLDPCGNAGSIVKARAEFCLPEMDGLALRWTDRGLVFVNPPYGDGLPTWIAKIVMEATDGAEIVALVPARTDTRWFQPNCLPPIANAVCWWRGRLTFLGAKQGATFPSAVIY